MRDSNDISLISTYQSRNFEFRKFPLKLIVTLPSSTPQEIIKGQIYQQFGCLSALCLNTEENGYTMDSPGAESSPPYRPLIDVTTIITNIYTGYKVLCMVSCLNNEEICICGNNEIINLDNPLGKLMK